MRPDRRGTALALSLLAGALLAPRSAAQEPVNRLHYPLDEEQDALLQAADRAREAGRWEEAARLYQGLLEADRPAWPAGGPGYQLASWPAPLLPGQPRRLRGLTQGAIDGLRALPPEGVAAWRRQFDARARAACAEALRAPDPPLALARAGELYPLASCTAELLEALGDLALEAGDPARARRAYAELLAAPQPAPRTESAGGPERIGLKLLACALAAGEPERVEELATRLAADDGHLRLGGVRVSAAALVARARERQAARARAARFTLALPRGDAAQRAARDQPLALGDARFAPRWFDRPDGGPLLRTRIPGAPARYLPLVGDDTAFLITADQLIGIDLRSGEPRPPIPRLDADRPVYREGNTKALLAGALERGVLVAPQLERVRLDQRFRGIQVSAAIPLRKLAGFETGAWRWRWSHALTLPGTPQADWSWPTAPVCAEGVGFAAAWGIQGWVNRYATAFDVRTGRLLWTTWVVSGQIEQTMFGEQAAEPLCTAPALSDGVLYHLTCAGCLAALSADTGRPLWVAEYEQLEIRPPRGFQADVRPIQWENNPPLVEAGVVVVAPLDAPACYGFDAASGRLLWQVPRSHPVTGLDLRYVQGAARGRVVVAGGHDVTCLDARTGQRLWRTNVGASVVVGRGLIAGERVCVPLEDQACVLDLQDGRLLGRSALSQGGNLSLCGPHALVTSPDGALLIVKNRD